MRFYHYLRQEYERLHEKQMKMIRLKKPEGSAINYVHTLTGHGVTVGNNGTIEVSEENAKLLIALGWRPV